MYIYIGSWFINVRIFSSLVDPPLYSRCSFYCTMTTLLMMLLFVFLGKVCPARIQLSPTSKDDVSPDRQVLVDVAGYGEDKISTVLVTGSVLCDLDRHGNGGRVTSQPVPGTTFSTDTYIYVLLDTQLGFSELIQL